MVWRHGRSAAKRWGSLYRKKVLSQQVAIATVSPSSVSTTMQTYKTIFRSDYPLCRALIDQLGACSGRCADAFEQNDARELSVKLDVVQRLVRATASFDEDSIQLQVSPTAFTLEMHHPNGQPLADLHATPALVAADRVFDFLGKKLGVLEFRRLGLRVWIVSQSDPSLTFQSARDLMVHFNKPFGQAAASVFDAVEDIGLCIETKESEGLRLRVLFGPYRSAESHIPHI